MKTHGGGGARFLSPPAPRTRRSYFGSFATAASAMYGGTSFSEALMRGVFSQSGIPDDAGKSIATAALPTREGVAMIEESATHRSTIDEFVHGIRASEGSPCRGTRSTATSRSGTQRA
jgi:hypothetical protein